VFAGLSFALAVAAHRLAGGVVPSNSAWFVLGSFFVVGLVAAGRERSGRFLGSLVLVSQLAAHLLFAATMFTTMLRQHTGRLSIATLQLMLLCHHGHDPVSGTAIRRATVGMNLDDLRRDAPTAPTGSSVHLQTILAAAAPMLAAHLAAAAVMAWWLRRGERAVWGAARRIVVAITGLVRGLPGAPRPPWVRLRTAHTYLVRISQWSLPLSRRGPPAAAVPTFSCS
jgi:hypothetical protein